MRRKTIKKQDDKMQEVLEYANKNSGLLFIVGNPLRDEIVISFAGKSTYLRFPQTDDVKENVLVKVLSKSDFKDAMNEIMTGLVKGLGVSPEDGNQLYQVVGGALQSAVYGNKKQEDAKK